MLLSTDDALDGYPDLDAAHAAAIDAARQIMSWAVRDGKQPDGQSFVITDEAGIVRLEFPFKDTLSPS